MAHTSSAIGTYYNIPTLRVDSDQLCISSSVSRAEAPLRANDKERYGPVCFRRVHYYYSMACSNARSTTTKSVSGP